MIGYLELTNGKRKNGIHVVSSRLSIHFNRVKISKKKRVNGNLRLSERYYLQESNKQKMTAFRGKI